MLLPIFLMASISTVTAQYSDTVYVSIPEGQYGSYCADLTEFGTITSLTNFCPDQSGEFATFIIDDIEDGCVDYFGTAGGAEVACVSICDDVYCDSILLWVDVIAPLIPCTPFFNEGSYNLGIQECSEMTGICLTLALEDIGDFEITQNGNLYENGFAPCLLDTIYAYSFSTLTGQGEQGPYGLDDWSINGNSFSGTFDNLSDLVSQMNNWDPTGNWALDLSTEHTIVGGTAGYIYGSIVASIPDSPNTTATLNPNIGIIPLGTRTFFDVGTHTVIVRNLTSGCSDTASVNIYCITDAYISETVYLNTSGSICLDYSQLPGSVISIENSCPENGTGNGALTINPTTNCIDYTGLGQGQDAACIVVCDDLGLCHTTYINLTILEPEGGVIEETLEVGETQTYCPGISDLAGTVTSIVNFCDDADVIDFVIDETTLCISYTAIGVGVDTACIAICDDLGACDTTYFVITSTLENYPLPEANNDYDSTSTSTAISIDITKNDLLSNADIIEIISAPMDGQVQLVGNGSVVYLPNEFFCGHDYFTYEICNPNGNCSQATVEVYVNCPELEIFNGVSPNGDGINDYFVIDGIEKYPASHLYVYNRWGHLVYESVGYDNDWNGTWEGKKLPSNTYMYVLELNDFSFDILNGYLYIIRE